MGIAWDENNPVAVINDEVVRVGDQVQGHSVVKIEQNKVTLSDGVELIEIRLAN